jgi:ketosteroid isomerase-like protein
MSSKEKFREAEAIWSGADSTHVMENHETIQKYYEYANAGKWDAWCDLFTDDMVMDEQLAGNIIGLDKLRPMMAGMGQAYAKFQNVLKSMVVEGNEGAVVSHISAAAAKYPGEPIEAEVMNFFRFRDGKISYMRNVHDTKPFAPFIRQISGG